MVNQLEALQEHPQDQGCLLHSEVAANAGALSCAKWQPGVRWLLLLGLTTEMVRVEQLGLLPPDSMVSVHHWGESKHRLILVKRILIVNDGILIGTAREPRGSRCQAQCFLKNLGNIGKLLDLLIGWLDAQIAAQHTICFLVSTL